MTAPERTAKPEEEEELYKESLAFLKRYRNLSPEKQELVKQKIDELLDKQLQNMEQ